MDHRTTLAPYCGFKEVKVESMKAGAPRLKELLGGETESPFFYLLTKHSAVEAGEHCLGLQSWFYNLSKPLSSL